MNEIKDYIDILQRKNVDIETLDLWVEEAYEGIEDKENIEEYMAEANRIMRKYAIEEDFDEEEPKEREEIEISFEAEVKDAVPWGDGGQEEKKAELRESIEKYEKLYAKYFEKQQNLKEEDKIRYYALKAKFAKLRCRYDRLQLKNLEDTRKADNKTDESLKADYQFLAERYNELVGEFNEVSEQYCFLKNKYRKLERRADDDVRSYVFMTLYQRYFESIRLAEDFEYDEIPKTDNADVEEEGLGRTDAAYEEGYGQTEAAGEEGLAHTDAAYEEGYGQAEAAGEEGLAHIDAAYGEGLDQAETVGESCVEPEDAVYAEDSQVQMESETGKPETEEQEKTEEREEAEGREETGEGEETEEREGAEEREITEEREETGEQEEEVQTQIMEAILENTDTEEETSKDNVETAAENVESSIRVEELPVESAEETMESRVERINRNIDDAIERINVMNQTPYEEPAGHTDMAAAAGSRSEHIVETVANKEEEKPSKKSETSPNSYAASVSAVPPTASSAGSGPVFGTTVYSWEAEPEAYVVEVEPEELEENRDETLSERFKLEQVEKFSESVEETQSEAGTEKPLKESGEQKKPDEAALESEEYSEMQPAVYEENPAGAETEVETETEAPASVCMQTPEEGAAETEAQSPACTQNLPAGTEDSAGSTETVDTPPFEEPELQITYEELDSVDLIDGCFWCMKNGYEREALERLVKQMPSYYVESGILYYCENEEEKSRLVEQLQLEYKNTPAAEKYKFDNINDYIMKYRSINLGENSIKIRISDTRQPMNGYSSVRESEDVSLFFELRRSIQLYDELCSLQEEFRSLGADSVGQLAGTRDEKIMQYLKDICDLRSRTDRKENISIDAEEVYYTRGRIESFNPEKGFGKVISTNGEKAHFMSSKIKDDPDMYREGVQVIYKTGKNENGYFVIEISIAK